jgi:RNA 3'-terminal phosphate cyclase (ATP)
LPFVNRMGPQVEATLDRPGFYPAGGGRFRVALTPAKALAPLVLETRGAVHGRRVRAVVASLPRAIAERELAQFVARTHWDSSTVAIEVVANPVGPGNVLIAELESEHVTEVFTGFGEKQVRAESVANACADEVLTYLASDAPVGPHLADQLVLLLALAGEGTFRTTAPTMHTRTQLEVIGRFLGPVVSCADEGDGVWRVRAARKGG